jgi:hypothetical protein
MKQFAIFFAFNFSLSATASSRFAKSPICTTKVPDLENRNIFSEKSFLI